MRRSKSRDIENFKLITAQVFCVERAAAKRVAPMPPIGWRKNSGFKTPGEAASSGMGNIISYFKPKPKPKPGRPSNESKAGRKSATPPENLWTGLKPPTAAEKAAAAKANSTARNLASAANKAKSGEVLDAVETAAVIQAAAAATKAPGVKRHRTNWCATAGGRRQRPWLFCPATTSGLR